jgi:hypothetical protein
MPNIKALITTFISLFAGALVSELQTMLDTGHMAFTTKSVEHMSVTGAVTAAVALYHLYTPSPKQLQKDATTR